jgi:hypothetical protein
MRNRLECHKILCALGMSHQQAMHLARTNTLDELNTLIELELKSRERAKSLLSRPRNPRLSTITRSHGKLRKQYDGPEGD